MPADLAYPYRPQAGRLVLLILVIGALGIFNLTHGTGAADGQTLIGQMQLNLHRATAFDLISGAVMFLALLLSIYQLFVTYIKRREIALEPSGVRLPVGLMMREITIAYVDIQSVLHQKIRRGEFLTITTQAGKQAFIASRVLPSKDAFAQIRAELSARAKAAQGV